MNKKRKTPRWKKDAEKALDSCGWNWKEARHRLLRASSMERGAELREELLRLGIGYAIRLVTHARRGESLRLSPLGEQLDRKHVSELLSDDARGEILDRLSGLYGMPLPGTGTLFLGLATLNDLRAAQNELARNIRSQSAEWFFLSRVETEMGDSARTVQEVLSEDRLRELLAEAKERAASEFPAAEVVEAEMEIA